MIMLDNLNREQLKHIYRKAHTELSKHEQGIKSLEPKEIIQYETAKKEIRNKLLELDMSKYKEKKKGK